MLDIPTFSRIDNDSGLLAVKPEIRYFHFVHVYHDIHCFFMLSTQVSVFYNITDSIRHLRDELP